MVLPELWYGGYALDRLAELAAPLACHPGILRMQQLAKEYGVEGIGPCHYKAGQEFICDRHREPEGMCGEAWKCIQHYAYALYHGADTPFGEGWMRKPGVAIATCNDGIRPVTFKLERIEMEE